MIMELGKMQWLQYGYKTANPFGCRKEAFLKKKYNIYSKIQNVFLLYSSLCSLLPFIFFGNKTIKEWIAVLLDLPCTPWTTKGKIKLH